MKFSLCGHFAPEVGRAMEEEFSALLELLGYRVLRRRDPRSGLDIIAKFHGEPIPKPLHRCKLLQPIFSPNGKTAYSLKRGDFTTADVDELLKKVEKARGFTDDEVLKDISGSVIVTNYSKTEEKLDSLLSDGVYCWDIRRLIFYSIKIRSFFDLANNGPVVEFLLNDKVNGSYLQETDKRINGMMLVNICVFIDDHNRELIIGYDEIDYILNTIYEKSIKNIIDSTQLDIQGNVKFYILGIANGKTISNAYTDYVSKQSIHPRMQLYPKFEIFQFGAAPWMAIYKKLR